MTTPFAFAQSSPPFRIEPLRPSPDPFAEGVAGAGIRREVAWREPLRERGAVAADAIIATRWIDDRTSGGADSASTAPGRHEIAIAMKTTRLKLSRASQTLFDGLAPAGTLYVADAALPLKIEFQAPCDFIHLSVPDAWLLRDGGGEGAADRRGLDGFTMRDALAEGLARSLIDVETGYSDRYAESVGQTIVMRLLAVLRERAKITGARVSPLPRWRLKRVQEFVAAHIGDPVSLPQLASVAGLSRMHFAAQFRAATGYRPHEYLLYCRIEGAKAMLAQQNTPIVEVALSVGFQAQAHFSTVFKRLTRQTPLQWRRASQDVAALAAITARRGGREARHA